MVPPRRACWRPFCNENGKGTAEDAEDAEKQTESKEKQLEINQVSGQIVDAAMKVHSALGRAFWNRPTKHACSSNCISVG